MASVALLRKAARMTVISDPASPARYLVRDPLSGRTHIVVDSKLFHKMSCDCTAAAFGSTTCAHVLATAHFTEKGTQTA